MEKHGDPTQPPPAYTQAPNQQGGYPQQQGGYPQQPGGYPQQQGGYPQQQGGYPQAGVYQQQQQTIVTTQPTVYAQQRFREVPVRTVCPQCQAEVMTSTSYESGTFMWMVVGGTCFVLLWFGLCCFGLIPLCINSLKDVVHTCPNCKGMVGKFNRAS